jgi:hypothetical protein
VLAEHVPPAAVRLRRDFATLMSLIAAHALLHRDLRPKDEKGRIQAIVRDYEIVQGLVATLFAEGVEATVPPTVRTTVEAVKAIASSEVSIAALAKHLGLDKSSVRSRVRKAIGRCYLINNEPKEGLPARITLGDPLPNETQILPSPDVLRGDPGGEGHETRGISPRDPESNEAVSGKAENSGKSPRIDPKSAPEAEKLTEKASKSAEDPHGASVPLGETISEPYPPI